MTLKDCTKAELLEIIQELEISSSSTAISVQRALGKIVRRRADEKFNKSERLLDLSSAKLEEYSRLLEPYDGLAVTDIPSDVLEKANAALSEVLAANFEWDRLMGLSPKRKEQRVHE